MEKQKDTKSDSRRFWFGSFICLCGVTMLFIAMFINAPSSPKGEISGSVLGAVGEIFLLGGSVLGLDGYVNYKIKKFLQNDNK